MTKPQDDDGVNISRTVSIGLLLQALTGSVLGFFVVPMLSDVSDSKVTHPAPIMKRSLLIGIIWWGIFIINDKFIHVHADIIVSSVGYIVPSINKISNDQGNSTALFFAGLWFFLPISIVISLRILAGTPRIIINMLKKYDTINFIMGFVIMCSMCIYYQYFVFFTGRDVDYWINRGRGAIGMINTVVLFCGTSALYDILLSTVFMAIYVVIRTRRKN